MCHEKQDNTQNDKNIYNHGPYKQDHSSNTNVNKCSRALDTIGNYSGRLTKKQDCLNSSFMIDWKCQVIKTAIPGQMQFIQGITSFSLLSFIICDRYLHHLSSGLSKMKTLVFNPFLKVIQRGEQDLHKKNHKLVQSTLKKCPKAWTKQLCSFSNLIGSAEEDRLHCFSFFTKLCL